MKTYTRRVADTGIYYAVTESSNGICVTAEAVVGLCERDAATVIRELEYVVDETHRKLSPTVFVNDELVTTDRESVLGDVENAKEARKGVKT